jgi:hypothetical protein
MSDDLIERLQQAERTPGTIVPAEMDTSVNSQGQRSRIARYRADAAVMLRGDKPFRLALPAYYGDTTDGTADNTETFSLPHSVVDAPATQSVVVWLDGDYYGAPDAVDYQNDTIDVTDAGTGSNLHVYYISDAPATLEIRKAVPDSSTSSSKRVYKTNAALVHGTKQSEQPEYLNIGSTQLGGFVAADMTVDVYVDAPYNVRFSDPDGDGTEPTNAMLNLPVFEGRREIRGLKAAVKAEM